MTDDDIKHLDARLDAIVERQEQIAQSLRQELANTQHQAEREKNPGFTRPKALLP